MVSGRKTDVNRGLFIIVFIFFQLSCSQSNLLSEFAKKDTDEARLKAVKIHLNKSEWSEAINEFTNMSTDYLQKREVKVLHASAYAGRCGLNLLKLAQALTQSMTSLLFKFLMAQYPSATSDNRNDCKEAETIMKSISNNASERTVDENLLLVFLSFAKIGVTLSAHADKTTVDGAPDAGWNGCTNDSTNFPESSVREVGASLSIALTSLHSISSASTIGSGQLTTLTNLCGDLQTINASYNFCSITDASSFTAQHVTAIRSLVIANEFVGIGSCNDTLSHCICP